MRRSRVARAVLITRQIIALDQRPPGPPPVLYLQMYPAARRITEQEGVKDELCVRLVRSNRVPFLDRIPHNAGDRDRERPSPALISAIG
jgi:hypothetical protein